MKSSSWIKFAGVILLLISMIFIFLAWQHYDQDKEFINQALQVEGRVTSFEEYKQYEGAKTEYAPIFTYSVDGTSREFYSHVYEFNKSYEPEDSATLYISKENPEVGLIDSFSERWVSILISLAVAFVLLVLAGVMLLIKWQ